MPGTLTTKFESYKKNLKKLFIRSGSITIKRFGKVYKIAVRSAAIKQLNREILNSQTAQNWEIYSGHVVALKKVTPGVAMAPLIEESSQKSHKERYSIKRRRMIKMCSLNLPCVLQAPKCMAREIIGNRMKYLEININKKHPLYLKFRNLIHSRFFNFFVPLTPMHGDFLPSNALLADDKLMLIDWEYALEKGSILYDWWYINHLNDSDENAELYSTFIKRVLKSFDLTYTQFLGFGYAMLGVAYFSAIERKKSNKSKEINNLIDNLDQVVSKES